MKKILDERGKTCPVPVVEARNTLENLAPGDELEVVVDNAIAVENLLKMGTQLGLKTTWSKVTDAEYRVVMTQKVVQDVPLATPDADFWGTEESMWVVVLSSESMGTGDETLGKVLMKGFLYALTELDTLPQAVLMYNGGARLSASGSECLEDLLYLESQGVDVLTCGTCLDYLGLDEAPEVGTVTNMYHIAEIMGKADKLVQP